MTVNKYSVNAAPLRHELKFLCSETDLKLIESKIKCICKRDIHTGSLGEYQIRSLYFDSPNMMNYENTINGCTDREKYRLRIYNASDQMIKLEKKSTLHGMKMKQACNISKEQCCQLLNGEPLKECAADQALLQQFLFERAAQKLAPTVIVEYKRTPFVYPIGNVRVTFDRNITSISPRCLNFFAAVLPGRAIMKPGQHILEVKYDQVLPSIIVDCINSSASLYRTAFSKYVLCIQHGLR